MTQDEFIDKWLVGYESREQKEEFVIEMRTDLASLQPKGKTTDGKTAAEILEEFGCPAIPFDENVTMYYPAILSAMEEYAQSHAKPNHSGKTKEEVWEEVQSYHQIEGTIPEGSRVEAAVYDAMERFANQQPEANKGGWLSVPDVRNKLGPFANLIAMIDAGLVKITTTKFTIVSEEIEQCRKSLEYLSNPPKPQP